MEYKYFVSTPNQEYTDEFLKQIREEDLVAFDGVLVMLLKSIIEKL